MLRSSALNKTDRVVALEVAILTVPSSSVVYSKPLPGFTTIGTPPPPDNPLDNTAVLIFATLIALSFKVRSPSEISKY